MDLSECTLPKCGTQIENFEKVSLVLPLELTHILCYLTHFFFSFREGQLVVMTKSLSVRGQDTLTLYVGRGTCFSCWFAMLRSLNVLLAALVTHVSRAQEFNFSDDDCIDDEFVSWVVS